MPAGRRNGPQWAVVRGMLHMRIKDVAEELNVSITYLRRLCRENGYRQWPGKQVRYMNGIGMRNVVLQVADARESSPWEGLAAGPSQLATISENKEEEDKPVANHPPRELVTLNLIDKVGSSSSSKRN